MYIYYYILPSRWVHVILSLSQTACQPTPLSQISKKPPPKNWPPVRRTCSTLSPAARLPQNKMAASKMAPRGRNSWEKICGMVAVAHYTKGLLHRFEKVKKAGYWCGGVGWEWGWVWVCLRDEEEGWISSWSPFLRPEARSADLKLSHALFIQDVRPARLDVRVFQ